MTTGLLVWCTITATLNIMGTDIKDYDTAAKGVVRSVFGATMIVDFSEYAKKQSYIGDYHAIQVEDYMCTSADP